MTVGGNVKWVKCLQDRLAFSYILTTLLLYDLATELTRIYPKEPKARTLTQSLHTDDYNSFTGNCQNPKVISADEWINYGKSREEFWY